MRRIGQLYYGYDQEASAWVVNYTHHWFSVGVTTSGGLGVWVTNRAAKRRGAENGNPVYQHFRGFLGQAGLWWIKWYVYVYLDGDGRE